MAKKWKDLIGLQVQDPKDKIIFYGKYLVWSEVSKANMCFDRVAKIPLHRVDDFIKGEEMNPEAPCTFTRRKAKTLGLTENPSLRGSVTLRWEL